MLTTLDGGADVSPEAYGYLFKIRYADKLFFDIDVDEKYLGWKLPAFSLQPLIDNAVKHNSITRTKPFHISVRTEEGLLVVSNPKVPKLEPEPSTGIGLENLRNRWNLHHGQRHRNRRRRRHLLRAHAAAKSLRMMKALIIEDETAAARNLAGDSAADGSRPWRSWRRSRASRRASNGSRTNPHPDLLFMDIHLADGDSFRIFDAVEIAAPVIFTTAYDQLCTRSFQGQQHRLPAQAAQRGGCAAVRWRSCTGLTSDWSAADYGSRVRTAGGACQRAARRFSWCVCATKSSRCTASRIAYCYTCEREGHGLYGFDGAAYPLDKTARSVAGTCLPESEFFRANRQFIVARQAVAEIAVWFGSRLALRLERRNTRTDRHLQGPGSRIQALAYVGSPCRLVGSPADFAR